MLPETYIKLTTHLPYYSPVANSTVLVKTGSL